MGHPVLDAAADGALPRWAEASDGRRRHMERVADLMADWAHALGAAAEAPRWRAAAMLHDALRDAPADRLRPLTAGPDRALPGPVLHGPAAAALLARDGVEDDGLLRAIARHTLGHPELDLMGRALYLADYLEPGRTALHGADALRDRMPGGMDGVLRDVVRARIRHQLDAGRPLHADTIAFWNGLAHG